MPCNLPPKLPQILHALLLKTNTGTLHHLLFNSISTSTFSFNILLSTFTRASYHSLTLSTFSFLHRLGLPLDSFALCSATCSSSLSFPSHIPQIHAYTAKSGWLASIYLSSALSDSYGKLSNFLGARRMFDESPHKNTIFANAVLNGYVTAEQWSLGLEFVSKVQELGLQVDGYTMSAVLRISGELANATAGMQVHASVVRRIEGFHGDAFLLSALVDMYANCGLVDKAELLFGPARRGEGGSDVVLWTSMLNAYGRNGRFNDVIRTYEDMLIGEVLPDDLAFLAVLSACQHGGEILRGLRYFESMSTVYGVIPWQEHYGCVIGMLCKAGEVSKAWEIANEQSSGGDVGVTAWGALLSACRDRGIVEIGRIAAQKALQLDPGNVGIYVELSNLYARAGLWDEINELRKMMKEKGMEKDVGFAWVDYRT